MFVEFMLVPGRKILVRRESIVYVEVSLANFRTTVYLSDVSFTVDHTYEQVVEALTCTDSKNISITKQDPTQ